MPERTVIVGDGVAWLRAATLPAGHAIVTSLPDVSELPAMDLATWRAWFVDVVALACDRVSARSVAVFYQTDVKHDGRWIDKAHLVAQGAERSGAHCLWHKIVCRIAPGATSFGRPAYGHLLAMSRDLRLSPGLATPDVLPETGAMTWARAMPMTAAEATCRFLVRRTACTTVVDPFCGVGTILAVANAHGMDAIGVELSRKRARKAERLQLA